MHDITQVQNELTNYNYSISKGFFAVAHFLFGQLLFDSTYKHFRIFPAFYYLFVFFYFFENKFL